MTLDEKKAQEIDFGKTLKMLPGGVVNLPNSDLQQSAFMIKTSPFQNRTFVAFVISICFQ